MNSITNLICQAIFRGAIPEAALEWDIVEIINTTILRGSGESTSYHPHTLIRLNGKQIWKQPSFCFTPEILTSLFPKELRLVSDSGKRSIYVSKP